MKEASAASAGGGEGGGGGDGRFMVRFSHNSGYVLTMQSSGQIYHFQIRQRDGFYLIDDGPLLDSLEHVVDHYRVMPDGLPTTLQVPLRPKPKPPLPQMQFSTLPSRGRRGGGLPPGAGPPSSPNSIGRRSDGALTLPPKPKPRLSLDSQGPLITSGPPEISPTDLATNGVFIPEENIIILKEEVLGEGEFGSVYKGILQSKEGFEEKVAVKMLHEERLTSANREEFIREAKVMTNLNHHCVVRLIGFSQGSNLLMVQELVPFGSMLTYLQTEGKKISAEGELLVWASQIACGMKYLEEQRMVHRDLAARNILLASRYQAKISDFGLSRGLGEREYYRATQGGRWPIKWYAPESFNYGEFSSASDVWSFGVTLWEMFSYGAQPYGTMKGVDVIDLVERGGRLERPAECPEDIYRTMERCWSYKARERPTFKELFEMFASRTNYENVMTLIPVSDIV